MNINQFRASLPNGGLRSSLFKVFVPFPSTSPDSAATKRLSFNAEASSLPGDNLGVITLPYFSRDTKWAGDRTFDSWSFTAIIDNDMIALDAFKKWMSALNSHEGNVRKEDAMPISGYQVDIEVVMYDLTGKPIYNIKLIGAFATTISPIEVGWERKNEVARFNVTVEYQYWVDRNTDGDSSPTAGFENA